MSQNRSDNEWGGDSVLQIEEYIARRKKEDRINEFNQDQRNENMRICVNYVFEYFNNYLNITEAEERTVLKDEKIEKYCKELSDYDPEVRKWLIGIYSEYGKQMNKYIGNFLREDEFFFLYNSDKEFRSLSYDCYARLIKKCPFIKDQTEMLFIFIKDYHRVMGSSGRYSDNAFISEEINEWIEETWTKHQVRILEFVNRWMNYFFDSEDIWPVTHRKKSTEKWRKYDYDYKQKTNLFNIDSLYRKMPKKSYTKGRKQEFEILMMHWWIAGQDDDYWQEYLQKTILKLKDEQHM